METLNDVFGMPLFPHLYMIPLTLILGVFIGYSWRGIENEDDDQLPEKPNFE